MFEESVTLEDGTVKKVMAGSKEELDAAVKSVKELKGPVYPNINHPVEKGHDLVAVDGDLNQVLVDGTGAHNSPMDAIVDGKETGDPDVQASGLDEPAYKTVPVAGAPEEVVAPEPTKSEVAAARKDAE